MKALAQLLSHDVIFLSTNVSAHFDRTPYLSACKMILYFKQISIDVVSIVSLMNFNISFHSWS